MTAELPSALRVQSGQLPDALPRTLDEIEAPLVPSEPSQAVQDPTTLFLTIDTEDTYFTRPILMTGEGIGRRFGVFGILDVLDAHGMKATFFVNVYETERQPPGIVEGVVREISERGHEVGLHSHPSPSLEFYGRPLFRLSATAQADVLRWGIDLIDRWIGKPPVSFRAGAYALNDATFSAIEEVGIQVDSSCFYPSPNNHNKRLTVNAVAKINETLEVPVTTVLRAGENGELTNRKLDIDWLSVDELTVALGSLVQHRVAFAMFMMHSFSFIEKETRLPPPRRSPRARFLSEVRHDRYVEVYGPKPSMREAMAKFLEALVAEPAIQVRTLRDAIPELRVGAGSLDDIVPIVPLQPKAEATARS